MHGDIWTQHLARFDVGVGQLRFLRYSDFLRVISAAGITPEDVDAAQRADAVLRTGMPLTPDEETRVRSILSHIPVQDLRAACVVSPAKVSDGRSLEAWLSSLDQNERRTLDLYLDRLSSAEPEGVYGVAEAFRMGGVGIPIDQGLTFTRITLQQALVIGKAMEALHGDHNGSG